MWYCYSNVNARIEWVSSVMSSMINSDANFFKKTDKMIIVFYALIVWWSIRTCQQKRRLFIVVYKQNGSANRVSTAPTFQTLPWMTILQNMNNQVRHLSKLHHSGYLYEPLLRKCPLSNGIITNMYFLHIFHHLYILHTNTTCPHLLGGILKE